MHWRSMKYTLVRPEVCTTSDLSVTKVSVFLNMDYVTGGLRHLTFWDYITLANSNSDLSSEIGIKFICRYFRWIILIRVIFLKNN